MVHGSDDHAMTQRAAVPLEPLSSLDALARALRVLPGVGPKAAQRMALHLMQHDRDGARALAARARAARRDTIRHCERCNTFTEDTVCALCRSPRRDAAQLCVVETPADLLMVEHTQAYTGLYFVLMGRLSPLDGIGPKEIRLDRLLKRATDGVVREVILATNFTNEGEATAHYIGELLAARGLKVTPARARRAGRRRTRVRRRGNARAGAARATAAGVGRGAPVPWRSASRSRCRGHAAKRALRGARSSWQGGERSGSFRSARFPSFAAPHNDGRSRVAIMDSRFDSGPPEHFSSQPGRKRRIDRDAPDTRRRPCT